MFIKMGSGFETKKTNGLSHFLEHVLLKGSKKYSNSTEFKQALSDFGAVLRAETFKEYTYFTLICLPEYIEKSLTVLSEIFASPRFNKEEIETERQRIFEEILEYQDASGNDADIDEIASSLLWPHHPLGMKIQGTIQNVKKFMLSDLKNHFQKFFKPNNMLLCFAGNLGTRKNLKEFSQESFSFLKGTADVKISKILEAQRMPRISLTTNMGQGQIDAQICFSALPYNHPQITTLEMLNQVLGGSGSSRLIINLCEKRGLVYRIRSSLSMFSVTGTLDIDFSVRPGQLEKVAKEILKEIKRLKEIKISKKELSRAKVQVERDLQFSLENPEALSEIFGLDALLGKVRTPKERLEEIRKITVRDIQALAREIFIPQQLNFIVVGPFTEKEQKGAQKVIHQFSK